MTRQRQPLDAIRQAARVAANGIRMPEDATTALSMVEEDLRQNPRKRMLDVLIDQSDYIADPQTVRYARAWWFLTNDYAPCVEAEKLKSQYQAMSDQHEFLLRIREYWSDRLRQRFPQFAAAIDEVMEDAGLGDDEDDDDVEDYSGSVEDIYAEREEAVNQREAELRPHVDPQKLVPFEEHREWVISKIEKDRKPEEGEAWVLDLCMSSAAYELSKQLPEEVLHPNGSITHPTTGKPVQGLPDSVTMEALCRIVVDHWPHLKQTYLDEYTRPPGARKTAE